MENYGEKNVERPMTHLEGAVSQHRVLNSELVECVNRLDALCNKLGRSNYSKNAPTEKMPSQIPRESDGILDDFQGTIQHKSAQLSELRTAISYLEQHI